MNIQERDISDITPYSKNAKKHPKEQVKKIAASIQRFGFRQPVVVDKKGVIVIGHGRVEAAKELGMTTVPVTVADDLTDKEISALRLADNKLNESEWDMELVNMELGELDAELKELTGFEAMEVLDAQEDDFDTTPPEEPKSKLGDLYQLGEHRLLCGSATVITDVERLMDGEKADMVFTDPPYGVDYDGINNDSREGLKDLLTDSFLCMKESVNPGAACYVFHSDRCADIFHEVFRSFCHFSSMIVWKKQSLTLSQTDYQSIHEPCIYGWFLDGTHQWYGDRKETSVWEFSKESVVGHTTPKPLALIGKALANSSPKSGLVLDLFGGSGSTLIACEQLKRKCRMMELDPRYVDVIVARWEKLTGKKAELIT